MKKTLWILLGIVAIILLWGIRTYNGFVKTEEKMTQAWSQVENVYQRRLDLIPNLVSVVKAYSDYENKTLVEVVERRTMQAAAVKVNPEAMTQEQLLGFENTQQLLDDAVSDVIVSIENYPDLKAVENYQTFLAQYEGCENRILVERRRYNEMVQDYNKSVRSFPSNLIAGWFGFEEHPYFN
ncbi:MAG: LemA family protein [Bacteroidales bacterium]|nr:LemA family protein [Bacteroidales bacterium]MBR4391312.1 LemA family protein [Bacteroidales bacterium]